jgi:hypothetical protein
MTQGQPSDYGTAQTNGLGKHRHIVTMMRITNIRQFSQPLNPLPCSYFLQSGLVLDPNARSLRQLDIRVPNYHTFPDVKLLSNQS